MACTLTRSIYNTISINGRHTARHAPHASLALSFSQEFNENIMPGSSMVATSAVSSSTAAAAPSMDHPNNHHQQTTSGWPFVSHAPLSPFTAPSLHAQEQQQQQQSQTTAAASLSTAPDEGDFSKSHPSTAALDAAAATAATRLLGKPPEPPAVASGRIKSKATVTRTGNCGDAHRPGGWCCV